MKTDIKPTPKPTANSRLMYIASVVVILMAAVLIVLSIYSNIQSEEQDKAIEDQSKKTEQLIQEVKQLSEENRRLNQTNVNYAYCNAILLAQYTQNQDPITIQDLNKCILTSFPDGEGAPTINNNNENNQSSVSPSTTPTQTQATINGSTLQPAEPTTPQEPTTTTEDPLLHVAPILLTPEVKVNDPCLDALKLLEAC